jgi:dihydrofolate synthase/folylpolyglutamate synthase
VFQEAGYRTGLYTSPHLVSFTERIRVNGRRIPEAAVVRLTQTVRPAVERYHATFFESTTAVAFAYFAERNVEIAIVETGLGGRLDATNVLTPLVSVVTNVSIEHTDYLGETLEKIAREKGGIIKAGIPLVTAAEADVAVAALRDIADRNGAPFYRSQELVSVVDPEKPTRRGAFEFLTPGARLRGMTLGLDGPHQRENARLALATLEVLMRRRSSAGRFSRINPRAIRAGFRNVRANTGLAGRMQKTGRGNNVLLDVAHNPEGARTLVQALGGGEKKFTVVFGVMNDKDLTLMLSELTEITEFMVAVAPTAKRALEPKQIQKEAEAQGIRCAVADSVARGVSRARRRKGRVLVTGSHYVVGEALEYLKKAPR